MNVARRAKAMLVDPLAEWTLIEQEPGDPAFVLTRYVAVLGLIPALFGFLGTSIIGVIVPGAGTVRAPIVDGLFGAIFGYVTACATVLVLGLIINLSAAAGISTAHSSLRSIPSRQSGLPGPFSRCQACAFSCSPASTASIFCGSACHG
jgi:hypothetical protein